MRGVVALDVEGRIGLGIAETLRVLEAGLEGDALGLHAGQDVVAGAVEDAEDARHRVAGHRLAHRLDDRNAAGDRRLVVEQHALLLGDLGQRHAMPRQQRLVGGDDMAAGFERGLDAVARRPLVAADQFDEDVDVGRISPARRDRRTIRPSQDRCHDRALRSRAETAVTTMSRPHWRVSSAALSERTRTTDAPTVPSPANPTRNASAICGNAPQICLSERVRVRTWRRAARHCSAAWPTWRGSA